MLPKIVHPTFDVVVPSTKQTISMRPMVVREEKVLLIAKQAETLGQKYKAIVDVLQNCVVTPQIVIADLPMFDIEWLFLKLRSSSISNKITLHYRDAQDESEYSFEVDLDTVELEYPENFVSNATIKLSDTVGFTVQFPPIKLYTTDTFSQANEDQLFQMTLEASIDKIFDRDDMYQISKATPEERQEFIDNIPSKQFETIQEFFASTPHLSHKLSYTNKLGTSRTIELNTLSDFFTL